MPSRLFPLLFLGAVLVRIGLLLKMGDPFPPGMRSDANVYLELALNLWRDGTYGTRVSITYPPVYPMLIAPTFALDANADRFTAIYVLHGLLLAGGALALFPTLRSVLGDRRAWLLLAAAQFLFGGTFHGYNPQTETLFAAQILVCFGLCGLAWRRPERVGPWVALGLVCGLAVATRRFAAVLPLALGVLWLHDVLGALARRERIPLLRPVLLGVGFGIGLLPEFWATSLLGSPITPYTGVEGSSAAAEHLAAGSAAFLDGATRDLALDVATGQLAYLIFSTGGAPLILGLYLWRTRRGDGDPSLRRALGFLAYTTLGVLALTVLHILRFRLRREGFDGWDLYPRYLDPLETALVLGGAVAAHRLLVDGPLVERLRAGTWWARAAQIVPWVGIAGLAVWIAGVTERVRGGRMRSIRHWLRSEHGEAGLNLFPATGALVVVAVALWWLATRRPRWAARGWWAPVALAVVVSWGISSHSWKPRLDREGAPDGRPSMLRLVDRYAAPDAPLAVVVHKPGPKGRRYYAPGFRSDHPVSWISPQELDAWVAANRGGFVLSRRRDPKPALPFVAKERRWRIHSGEGRGAPGGFTPE